MDSGFLEHLWQLRAACRGLGASNWVHEPGREYPEEQLTAAGPARCPGNVSPSPWPDQSIPGLWGGTDERERPHRQVQGRHR